MCLQAFLHRTECGMGLSGQCFNPSLGLTSVPTIVLYGDINLDNGFNPSIGLTSVPTGPFYTGQTGPLLFQSLNRAYKRSDGIPISAILRSSLVSIPQSGLQAFRHCLGTTSKQPVRVFN